MYVSLIDLNKLLIPLFFKADIKFIFIKFINFNFIFIISNISFCLLFDKISHLFIAITNAFLLFNINSNNDKS